MEQDVNKMKGDGVKEANSHGVFCIVTCISGAQARVDNQIHCTEAPAEASSRRCRSLAAGRYRSLRGCSRCLKGEDAGAHKRTEKTGRQASQPEDRIDRRSRFLFTVSPQGVRLLTKRLH